VVLILAVKRDFEHVATLFAFGDVDTGPTVSQK
jgi:hypothetical protein